MILDFIFSLGKAVYFSSLPFNHGSEYIDSFPSAAIPSLAQHTSFISSKLYLNSLLGLRQVRKYSFLSFPVLNLYLKSSYYFISSCRKNI